MRESVGQRFRRLRKARGLSQRDVAHWLKLGMEAIASFERQWEKLEQTAMNQYIPREWIEPIPTLTTRKPQ